MNLDKNGLPVQANGDANDQLQRVGMIDVAATFEGAVPRTLYTNEIAGALYMHSEPSLQPEPGVYIRHVGGQTNNVSADQLIAALCSHLTWEEHADAVIMLARCLGRLGFAQNYRDGLGSNKLQVPDFMLLRAAPLFARAASWLRPLAYLADLYLFALVIGDWVYLKVGKDPVDVNNTLLTLAVCHERMPTPLSRLACWLWPRLRKDIYGALARYHRKEAGGNEEIAELFKPIIERIFK